MAEIGDDWYRYQDGEITRLGLDFINPKLRVRVHLHVFKVKRVTRACVVIAHYGRDKFVLKDARRRFCYPTKELAMNSYKIRKQKQRQHAKNSLDRATAFLKAVEEDTFELIDHSRLTYLLHSS